MLDFFAIIILFIIGFIARGKFSETMLITFGFMFGLAFGMLTLNDLYLTTFLAIFIMWLTTQIKI